MLGEMALSIILSPVGAMLAGAAASGTIALRAFRSVSLNDEPDALAGLFQREIFADKLRDPSLRHIRARGQQRTVQAETRCDPREREAMLHQVAAVIRGAERDPGIVQEATRYLAGEGFIILEDVAHPASREVFANIVEIGEFEEVKLLPAPVKAA